MTVEAFALLSVPVLVRGLPAAGPAITCSGPAPTISSVPSP